MDEYIPTVRECKRETFGLLLTPEKELHAGSVYRLGPIEEEAELCMCLGVDENLRIAAFANPRVICTNLERYGVRGVKLIP